MIFPDTFENVFEGIILKLASKVKTPFRPLSNGSDFFEDRSVAKRN